MWLKAERGEEEEGEEREGKWLWEEEPSVVSLRRVSHCVVCSLLQRSRHGKWKHTLRFRNGLAVLL